MKYALNQARQSHSEYVFKKIGFRVTRTSTRAPKSHSKSILLCMCEPKLFGEPSDYLNFVMRLRRDKTFLKMKYPHRNQHTENILKVNIGAVVQKQFRDLEGSLCARHVCKFLLSVVRSVVYHAWLTVRKLTVLCHFGIL